MTTHEELLMMSVPQLRARIKAHNIRGYSKMSKNELVFAIMRQEGITPAFSSDPLPQPRYKHAKAKLGGVKPRTARTSVRAPRMVKAKVGKTKTAKMATARIEYPKASGTIVRTKAQRAETSKIRRRRAKAGVGAEATRATLTTSQDMARLTSYQKSLMTFYNNFDVNDPHSKAYIIANRARNRKAIAKYTAKLNKDYKDLQSKYKSLDISTLERDNSGNVAMKSSIDSIRLLQKELPKIKRTNNATMKKVVAGINEERHAKKLL